MSVLLLCTKYNFPQCHSSATDKMHFGQTTHVGWNKIVSALQNLKMLPPEIWKKILYIAFIGQESPDTQTLDNCRQVCKDWNEMINRSVWQKPNKEWGLITKSMIEKNWFLRPGCLPSVKMISHAKGLGKIMKNQKASCSMRDFIFW